MFSPESHGSLLYIPTTKAVYKPHPPDTSTTQMNPASSITLASVVFNDVGHFLRPEHLAKLAKASKEMRSLAIPMLMPLRQNKQAMYDLLLRLFPNLRHRHLRDPANVTDASYYTGLLDAYFTSDHSKVPPQNIVSRIVDVLLYKKELSTTTTVKDYVMPAMQTAEGRRRVLRAVEERQGPLRRWIEDREARSDDPADEMRKQLQQALLDKWSQAHTLRYEMLHIHLTFEATLEQLPLPLTPRAAEQRARNHRALEELTQAINFFGEGVEQLYLPESFDLLILEQLEMLMRTDIDVRKTTGTEAYILHSDKY